MHFATETLDFSTGDKVNVCANMFTLVLATLLLSSENISLFTTSAPPSNV